ncbi:MAG: hypothetical protein K9L25_12530 [Methylovulum sp.]|nr:hypothetical protein [Methylovulum sp.]MCF8007495.1 hypothetical protein [Methylovulum sp.]
MSRHLAESRRSDEDELESPKALVIAYIFADFSNSMIEKIFPKNSDSLDG